MPTTHTYSRRLSKYIGVSEKSKLGKRAAGFGIDALSGHSAWATAVTDFGEMALPNVTALGAAPFNWTVTATAGVAGNSIVCNSNNGYLLVIPGTVDIEGYSMQSQFASRPVFNVLSPNHVSSGGVSNGTLAAGRQYFWGARVALSCSTSWSAATGGSLFMGIAITDTAVMTAATGALDGVTACFGIHITPDGVINLVKRVGGANQTAVFSTTATSLAHTSSSFRARDFHDFAIYGNWNVLAGTSSGDNILEAYIDGKLVASIIGGAHPSLSSATVYSNTFELLNGTGADCTMAIATVVNALPRYHID